MTVIGNMEKRLELLKQQRDAAERASLFAVFVFFGGLLLGFLIGGVMFSRPAEAACRSSYVCQGPFGGDCSYRDVCDSTLDLPSTNIRPLPALPSVRVRPLESIRVPPIGTTRCRQLEVDGRWRNVCQ